MGFACCSTDLVQTFKWSINEPMLSSIVQMTDSTMMQGESKMKKLIVTSLMFLLGVPSTALAIPFQINFSGELESLTQFGVPGVDVIDSIFTVGDTVSGQINVDTDDLSTTTISLFEMTIGSYTAFASGGTAQIRNDHQAGSAAPFLDSILIAGSNFTSTPIGGFSVDRLQFHIGTPNLSILSSISPVGMAEVLATWNDTPNYFSGNTNFMSFGNGTGADETARIALTSVSVSSMSVPEPASLTLMGLGLAGLGFARRKKAA